MIKETTYNMNIKIFIIVAIMTILIPIAETRTKAISNIMSPQTICLTNIKSKGVYYLIR